MRTKKNALKTIIYIILCVHAIICLFPILWTVLCSFKSNDTILSNPFSLSASPKFSNYVEAWTSGGLGKGILNTIFVSAVTTFTVLLISGLAAYATVKVFNTTVFYSFFILGMMVPVLTLLIPVNVILGKLKLLNSLWGLIFVYSGYFFSISYLLLYSFMASVPTSVEESAYIDGCNAIQVFFKIIMPMAIPGFATAGIMVMYQSWNEYLLPLVLITDSNKKTILQCVQLLGSNLRTDYGILLAAVVISSVPIIILYCVCKKYIMSVITAGAVKG